ncbi:fibroblast growth factor 4A [Thalassophryne amazonica]|uniref:fibroblast growth factor 4A n=1 Tax=Thalassophryne amazonica TaxID=390379 RepID=UPI001470C13E|nr:fibroblast growth factor 4A [Thalassophryne amazonica]XP_034042394.1 fibroblast growth factor 4A [Thalassophryne amazonica]
MNASMLLPGFLLLLVVTERTATAEKPEPADFNTRILDLWKLHMRESTQQGRGSNVHPMPGGIRQQMLYCRVGIGFHLQILPSGAVGGVHMPTDYCWMRVFAVKSGVVGIKGVKSGLYLCFSGDGWPYGAKSFTDDCLLKETLEENHYTTYSTVSYPTKFLALSHKGEVKRGSRVGRHQSYTHFLPLRSV